MWLGTIISLPSYVTGEGPTYQPAAALWVDRTSGLITSAKLERPEKIVSIAVAELGRARMRGGGEPAVVRVDRADLAAALATAFPDLTVEQGPVKELAPVIDAMRAHLGAQQGGAPASYMMPGVGPRELARWFRAMAVTFRAKPWSVIPGDVTLGLRCEALGISDGLLTVVGQMGTAYGLGIFPTRDDYADFLDMCDAAAAGHRRPGDPLPRHYRLDFHTKRELAPAMVREVAKHGWDIASPQAYPDATFADPQLGSRPLLAAELVLVAEIAIALVDMIARFPAVAQAWAGGSAPITHVRASDGIVVELVAPSGFGGEVHAFEDAGGEIDDDAVDAYVSRTLAAVVASSHGAPFEHADTLLECLAAYLGVTLDQVGPADVRVLLNEVYPGEVDVTAADAPAIIAELRVLLAFAAETYKSAGALETRELLTADLVQAFAEVLEDETRFSPTKTLLRQGSAAGFDMATREGIDAYLATMPRAGAKKPATKKKPGKKKSATKKKPATKKPKRRR